MPVNFINLFTKVPCFCRNPVCLTTRTLPLLRESHKKVRKFVFVEDWNLLPYMVYEMMQSKTMWFNFKMAACFVESNKERRFQNRQEDAQSDIFRHVSLGEEEGLS